MATNETPPTIALTLTVENVYVELGETITTFCEVDVPPMPTDPDDRFDWEQEHIFPHTGTGHTSGDAGYFVSVTQTSDPNNIPPGTEFEFC
jgi:hypothetical protein